MYGYTKTGRVVHLVDLDALHRYKDHMPSLCGVILVQAVGHGEKLRPGMAICFKCWRNRG